MTWQQKDEMRHHAVSLEEALKIEDPFTVHDIRPHLPDTRVASRWMQLLHKCDVVEKVDVIYRNNGNVGVWEWNTEARGYLQDRADNINTLPCGCRSHIPSDIGADSSTGTCNHCGEEFAKETFKNAL